MKTTRVAQDDIGSSMRLQLPTRALTDAFQRLVHGRPSLVGQELHKQQQSVLRLPKRETGLSGPINSESGPVMVCPLEVRSTHPRSAGPASQANHYRLLLGVQRKKHVKDEAIFCSVPGQFLQVPILPENDLKALRQAVPGHPERQPVPLPDNIPDKALSDRLNKAHTVLFSVSSPAGGEPDPRSLPARVRSAVQARLSGAPWHEAIAVGRKWHRVLATDIKRCDSPDTDPKKLQPIRARQWISTWKPGAAKPVTLANSPIFDRYFAPAPTTPFLFVANGIAAAEGRSIALSRHLSPEKREGTLAPMVMIVQFRDENDAYYHEELSKLSRIPENKFTYIPFFKANGENAVNAAASPDVLQAAASVLRRSNASIQSAGSKAFGTQFMQALQTALAKDSDPTLTPQTLDERFKTYLPHGT